MTKISVNPPSGFRDFTPRDSALRSFAMETIARQYRAYGFEQIFTAAAENLATLQGKGGGDDNEKLIFKILRRGEDLARSFSKAGETGDMDQLADMGLRFDLTLPLARYVSRFRQELSVPAKIFQIGPVWRADRPQKGRFREFLQCDVDVIGTSGVGAEVECLNAIASVLKSLGIEGTEIVINDRRLLRQYGTSMGFAASDWQQALVTLDKLDKIGVDGVEAEWRSRFPGHAKLEELLRDLPRFTSQESALQDWAEISGEAVASLGRLSAGLAVAGHSVRFNPGLVRGQDYYTGTIFEVRHPSLDGSIAGGGRYDGLLEVFGGPPTPAFGGSIGFERLMLLLEAKNAREIALSSPQWFLPVLEEKFRTQVTGLAEQLRASGLLVDVYPDGSRKLGQQLKYANQRRIPWVAILGESELTRGIIIVKDMVRESQEEIRLADFVRTAKELLKPVQDK